MSEELPSESLGKIIVFGAKQIRRELASSGVDLSTLCRKVKVTVR